MNTSSTSVRTSSRTTTFMKIGVAAAPLLSNSAESSLTRPLAETGESNILVMEPQMDRQRRKGKHRSRRSSRSSRSRKHGKSRSTKAPVQTTAPSAAADLWPGVLNGPFYGRTATNFTAGGNISMTDLLNAISHTTPQDLRYLQGGNKWSDSQILSSAKYAFLAGALDRRGYQVCKTSFIIEDVAARTANSYNEDPKRTIGTDVVPLARLAVAACFAAGKGPTKLPPAMLSNFQSLLQSTIKDVLGERGGAWLKGGLSASLGNPPLSNPLKNATLPDFSDACKFHLTGVDSQNREFITLQPQPFYIQVKSEPVKATFVDYPAESSQEYADGDGHLEDASSRSESPMLADDMRQPACFNN